jgi:putative heme degradation protein
LKDKTPETRKTQLACLIVFVGDKEKTKKYEEQMLKDNSETKNKIVKQEKTDKQKENWIDYEELKLIFDKMRDNVKPEELLKKRNIKGKDQQDLQNFILFGVM